MPTSYRTMLSGPQHADEKELNALISYINTLSDRSSPATLAIWGQGNAAELLHQVEWLRQCDVVYWGDIDEHGFHILTRLRKRYMVVRSVMMCIETLRTFQYLCGDGEVAGSPPKNLTTDEWAAFEQIQKSHTRLEQEKIPLAYSCDRVIAAFAGT